MSLIDLGERKRIDGEIRAIASHFESVDEYLSAIMKQLCEFQATLTELDKRLQRLEAVTDSPQIARP